MIRYPEILRNGDLIGITATSDGANLEKIDYAISNLKNCGYKIVETENVRKSEKLVSSDGETRAEEFLSLLNNENVKHIIAARGGEFLIDMIPYLHDHKEEINKNIKWIQGFSDTSLLLFYITTNYNIATLHAENLGEFAMSPYFKSIEDTLKIVSTELEFKQESYEKCMYKEAEGAPNFRYIFDSDVKYKNLYENEYEMFEGRLIGGCIDCLVQLAGTKFDNTCNFCNEFEEGMIWYIDNCELSAPSFYRALFNLKMNGWFKNANGFVIGRTHIKDNNLDFTLKDAIFKALGDLKVPVIYDADIGHVPPQWPLINGAYAKFEYFSGKGKILQIKK